MINYESQNLSLLKCQHIEDIRSGTSTQGIAFLEQGYLCCLHFCQGNESVIANTKKHHDNLTYSMKKSLVIQLRDPQAAQDATEANTIKDILEC